jgi:hypothetical protein
MTSMKRFGLAALFVIAVALVVGTSAPAVGGNSKVTFILAPTGAEPTALGVATLSNIRTTWYRQGGASYDARLRVVCEGLTPQAMYEVRTNVFDYENLKWVAWRFQASGTGGGAAGGSIHWSSWQVAHLGAAVLRVDETSEGTFYTSVLDGYPIY